MNWIGAALTDSKDVFNNCRLRELLGVVFPLRALPSLTGDEDTCTSEQEGTSEVLVSHNDDN